MYGIRALGALAVLAAATAPAATPAAAFGPGTTVLVSRPAGDLLPTGAVNGSDIAGQGSVSDSGRFVVFWSDADGLLAAPSPFQQVFRLDRLTGQILLVSATPAGAPGGGDSNGATISADGTVVAYGSEAEDLVAGTNDDTDVFVRDLSVPGPASQLVSRASDLSGAAPGNRQSLIGRISGDGDSVLFSSYATNLHPADTSSTRSTYLRTLDGVLKQTLLISRADGAAGASATTDAYGTAISADGQTALFMSGDAGLDPTVTDDNSSADVYARSLTSDQTRLVSRANAGGDPVGNAASYGAALSADGSIAAFQSPATNLAPIDANGVNDVFKRTGIFSGTGGTTTLVSRVPGAVPQAGNAPSSRPALSADGAVTAFVSDASDLLPAPDGNGTPDVFARSGLTTTVLSRGPGGGPAPGGRTDTFDPMPALSGDGTIGVFSADIDGLSAVDDDDFFGVYAAGVGGGPVDHLSRPPGLDAPFTGGVANSFAGARSVSADGRYVAFTSGTDSLSTEDDDRFTNAYVRDVLTGATTLVSRSSTGSPANAITWSVLISADGTHVAFASDATNLSPDDADAQTDTFVRDLRSGTTVLADRADGAGGVKANATTYPADIDADGSRVVFATRATNLGSGSDPDSDVFVRDIPAATTVLASRATGPAGDQASGESSYASISGDGNRVAFSSAADNLGDGDLDTTDDVHVRDLAAGTTVLVSRAAGAAGAKGDSSSQWAQISGGGGHVVFQTSATNLGDYGGASSSVYVRDLGAATTTLASRADGAAGAPADDASSQPGISDDGSRVVFGRLQGDLTGEAPATAPQVFLRDLPAGRTLLVSRGTGLAGPPLPVSPFGYAGAISGNGRCVMFTAEAPGGFVTASFGTGDFRQVYLRAVDGECAPAPPPSAPGGTATAPRDTVAPVLSKVGLLRSRFAVDRRSTPASAAARRRTPFGTQLRFTLSEAASVRITIARELPGARKGKACVKRTAKLRRAKRCTRLAAAGTLTRSRRPQGASRVAFTGRIGRKALKLGRHSATLVATDAAGNRSKSRTVRFAVARR